MTPAAGENFPAPETPGHVPAPPETIAAAGPVETDEAESSGDFRVPHPEVPAEFAAPEAEPVNAPTADSEPPGGPRPGRRAEPLRPRPWVKPADFQPAQASAISQAVSHATEIAESLKHMIDQLDEVLELVEIAERQKLADEREIDELRRTLRRIQPPRREPSFPRPPRREAPPRAPREPGPRPEGSPPPEPEEPQEAGA